MPDLFFTNFGYAPHSRYTSFYPEEITSSAWFPVYKGSSPTTLALSLRDEPPDDSFTLMLSIGIRYDTMTDAATVQQVEHAGSAKELGAV